MVQGSGQDSPEVTAIYTDGACSGNPGPGGWGAIARFSDGQVHEIGGAAKSTTNNRMELQAAIEILQWFASSPQTTPPTLYTDSKYVQDGITKWIKGWKKKQWKTSAGKPVLNQDLWQQLDQALQAVNAQLEAPLRWQYVKGHAGNTGNERCDAIARGFAQGQPPALSTVSSWEPSSSGSAPPFGESHGSRHKIQKTKSGHDPAIQPDAPTQDLTTQNAPVQDVTIQDAPTMNTMPDAATHTAGNSATNGTPDTTMNSIAYMQPTPLQHMIERLRAADELATHGFWVTTAELAHVVELSASTINGKGDRWLWRNWAIVRVQQESNPILWQLSRID
ncbi:MAG: ribonuclease HI [Cyanothece sp. SIO2G6]|nr:ribonuclease HI [Cyanothece sp. SIO2G6]